MCPAPTPPRLEPRCQKSGTGTEMESRIILSRYFDTCFLICARAPRLNVLGSPNQFVRACACVNVRLTDRGLVHGLCSFIHRIILTSSGDNYLVQRPMNSCEQPCHMVQSGYYDAQACPWHACGAWSHRVVPAAQL